MTITKNEAYLYAKRIFRLKLTHHQLEKKMIAEGFNDDDLRMVKDKLSKWSKGMTCY